MVTLNGSDAPRRPLVSVAGLVAFLVVWQLAARALPGQVSGPLEVAVALVRMLYEPFAGHTLLGHLMGSGWRFLAGFGLAAALGLPLGLLMGWFPRINDIMVPPFSLIRYVAPIAWVPFAILWFGTGIGGPILIIFSGAFATCVVGAFAGARMVDPKLIEASHTLGASNLRILLEVVLPSAVPALISAIRVAAGNAWQSLVGAELIVASSGLAYVMVRGQMNRTVTIVMVSMLVIGLVGLLLEALLRRLECVIERRFGKTG